MKVIEVVSVGVNLANSVELFILVVRDMSVLVVLTTLVNCCEGELQAINMATKSKARNSHLKHATIALECVTLAHPFATYKP